MQLQSGDSPPQNKPFLSAKDRIKVNHYSAPGLPKSAVPPPTFASTVKKPHFPNDLWKLGTQIYDCNNPARCLLPPTDKSDRILRFDSNFESGNLSQAFQISHDIYHLVLTYDKNNSGSCQWFYFKVTNIRSTSKYTFYISGFHKNSGVYHSGSRVFWYSERQARRTGITWSRGGSNYAYGVTKRDKGSKRSTLHFQITFPYENDDVYICYAIPYTYTNLLRSISHWQKIAPVTFKSEILCQSYGGKNAHILTITSSPTSGIPMNERKCLFFTARMHPGESNGSIMCHGLIDYLLSDNPGAKYLTDHCVIKIVPMICIDGVIEGNYRISLSGFDLNRVWTNPDPVLHPVVYATKEAMKAILRERSILYYIDFHGHSRLHGTFAYGCPNADDDSLRDSEKTLPKLLSAISDDFSWGRCVFSIPEGRKSAGRIVVRKELGVVQSFTIESSFGGCAAGPRAGLLYDEARWRIIGSKVGEALHAILTGRSSEIINQKRVPETKKNRKQSKFASLNIRKSANFARTRTPNTFIAASNRVITSRATRFGLI